MNTKEIAFRVADTNKDGYVDRKEFSKLSKNIPKEKMYKVVDIADKNHDGKLDYNEFKDMMESRKKK